MVKKVIKYPNRAHETELWAAGFELVAGVDEVGRGALAGPVVAAAVILPHNAKLPGARDSKLLTRLQRQQLSIRIKALASQIGLGWSSPSEVDAHGLSWAVQQSGLRALEALEHVHAVLLDGNFNYLRDHYQTTTIIKGDNCCLNIAAASIVAKEVRDRYMVRLHRLYPQYGFDTNVGYGTRRHLDGLDGGLSPLHRRSFAPVRMVAARVD